MSNIPTYNDCKHGRQTPDYLHPLLEDILKTNIWCYHLPRTGYANSSKTYLALLLVRLTFLRRAMGKKKRAELEKQKQGFL
jgi:DNA polymerase-3 subunit alpha